MKKVMKDIFLNVQYLKKLHELHGDLKFLQERKKIKNAKKLLANLHDKNEYVLHIRNSKQALKHGFILKTYIEYFSLIQKHG